MNKKKLLIFLGFNLFISIYLISQEQIIPKKCIFKNSLDRIYINKSLPLYIKISDNKLKQSNHFLLKNDQTGDYTPIYLVREGLNIFYSPSAVDTITKKTVYPKFDVKFEVYADGTPPVTKIHNNIISYNKSDSIFFGKGLKISFSAKDNLSKVDKIYLSINKQAFEEYPHDTLSFNEQGEYFIQYYATDKVGNVEKIKKVHFFIDTTRPFTNLVLKGEHINNIVSPNCEVTLKPQDAFSGNAKTFYYIDNENKKIYSSPIKIRYLSEGKHYLHYFSEDEVNNKEDVNSFEFYLDKTPPMIMPEIIGDYIIINGKKYTSGRTKVQLNAIDNKAGVKDIFYSFDGKEWKKYEESIELQATGSNVSLFYYAVDNVGNTSKGSVTNQVGNDNLFLSEMDLTPPKISYSFQGKKYTYFDTLYISPDTKISVSSYDNQSGVNSLEYSINDMLPIKYNKSFSIDTQGYYEIMLTAFDNVNNMQAENFSFFVDATGPEIDYKFSTKSRNINGKIVLPQGAKLFLSAFDNETDVDNIRYSINKSSMQYYTNYIKFNNKGDYSIEINASDVFGNITKKEITFTIQ